MLRKIVNKIKCKLLFHDLEIVDVMIRPVLYDHTGLFGSLPDDIKYKILSERLGHMWKCKNCNYERLI